MPFTFLPLNFIVPRDFFTARHASIGFFFSLRTSLSIIFCSVVVNCGIRSSCQRVCVTKAHQDVQRLEQRRSTTRATHVYANADKRCATQLRRKYQKAHLALHRIIIQRRETHDLHINSQPSMETINRNSKRGRTLKVQTRNKQHGIT